MLATVPLAWGTWSVANVAVLDIWATAGALPPPPPLLNAAIQCCSLAALTAVCVCASSRRPTQLRSFAEKAMVARGGLELGGLLFVGSTLQLYALQLSTASRVAFIVQTTTVLVPLLESAIKGGSVAGRTWAACFMAMAGIAVLSFGDGAAAAVLPAAHATGDCLALVAAVFFACHVVRLERFARRCAPLRLAWAKAAVQAFLTLALTAVASAAGAIAPASALEGLMRAGPTPVAAVVALLVWNGVVPSAYTVFAQSYAQARVSPAEANLWYSAQPVAAAALAALFLGEQLGTNGLAGGALIVGACVFGGGGEVSR